MARRVYVHQMRDVRLAEAYCDRMYAALSGEPGASAPLWANPGSFTRGDIYLKLIQVCCVPWQYWIYVLLCQAHGLYVQHAVRQHRLCGGLGRQPARWAVMQMQQQSGGGEGSALSHKPSGSELRHGTQKCPDWGNKVRGAQVYLERTEEAGRAGADPSSANWEEVARLLSRKQDRVQPATALDLLPGQARPPSLPSNSL